MRITTTSNISSDRYRQNACRQAKYRRRLDAGLVTISLEVDPELLAVALNKIGIHLTQDRENLARSIGHRPSMDLDPLINDVVADSVTE
jgi:hypothetical protein